jgi:hypothetical protein
MYDLLQLHPLDSNRNRSGALKLAVDADGIPEMNYA